MKLNTKEKFESLNFEVGDTFTEMLSHWKVIVKNESGKLTTIEGNSKSLEIREYYTPEDFRTHCSYKSIPGYWVDYLFNSTKKASDFVEHYCELNNISLQDKRDLLINFVLC